LGFKKRDMESEQVAAAARDLATFSMQLVRHLRGHQQENKLVRHPFGWLLAADCERKVLLPGG
jgi:hypothetical protein